MPTNKHAQIRYLALDKCLSNRGRRYYIGDLVTACNEAIRDFTGKNDGVKKRQVYEDIKFMESERGWSAIIEKIKDGKQVYYRYKDDHYSINQSPLSEVELTQIKEVIFTLSRFTGLPQFEWVSEISNRLRTLSNNRLRRDSRVIDFEQNQYLKGLEHISTLFNAINNNRTVSIKYLPFKGENVLYHQFHPYYLKQYNLRWFVFGLTEGEMQLTNFALDRIQVIEELQIPFIPNKDIDFNEYFEDIIGVTLPENGKIETVVISVASDLLPYLETKPLHGSQKRGSENGVLMFQLIINYELISKLLAFGDRIKVLQPLSLVNTMRHKIQLMKSQYD
ncbi:MAG: transcriptional regulator [Mucilaginibacter sp.]|nr:transcriptional regulator [Mucilaginibacter sp.]